MNATRSSKTWAPSNGASSPPGINRSNSSTATSFRGRPPCRNLVSGGGAPETHVAVCAGPVSEGKRANRGILGRRHKRWAVWGTIVIAGVSFWGCWGFDYDGTLVYNYCAYDAASQAQVAACEENVTAEEVERRDSEAAVYAREMTASQADDQSYDGR